MINHDFVRTISIIKELAKGKTLSVGTFTLGMGEDMSVGFLCVYGMGEGTMAVSSMTLDELNSFLNKHEIGLVIPTYRELSGL